MATVNEIDVCCKGLSRRNVNQLTRRYNAHPNISKCRVVPLDGHIHVFAQCTIDDPYEYAQLERGFRAIAMEAQAASSAEDD